jgi:hypothetical protein
MARRGAARRWLGAALLAGAALLPPSGSARAQQPIAVDVELVLAVDVSLSMTAREREIQRRGYAEALRSEAVVAAITSGMHGRVALSYVEWAGAGTQRVVVDWTLLAGRGDAEAFAARLTAHASAGMQRTSISGVIDFARRSLGANRFEGARRVIDVSGDGPNNQGRPVTEARDAAVARGIVINGLPLMTREGMGAQWHLEDLDRYYRQCVIGGAGAFVIPVLEWRDFPAAVRNKLVLDLVGGRPRPRVVPAQAAEGYDCLVGEKIWDRIRDGWN